VVNLSRLAHGSRADDTNGLLGAQPGRPKFDVLSQLGLARTSYARLPVALPRCAGCRTGAPANRSPGQV